MKKFVITEDEKRRILNLYEKVGEPLDAEALTTKKANYTKEVAKKLNAIYNINLKTATTGDWQDTEFNNTLKKFMEEKGIPVHICKSNDGWCGPNTDGEVTAGNSTDSDKLYAALDAGKNQNANVCPQPTTATHTYEGDKQYQYAKSGDCWWAQNITSKKWFNLTELVKTNQAYQKTIDNLNKAAKPIQ